MTNPIQALQQQRLLLQLEYQAEKESFRKQTEEMGLLRKVKRGDAWYPLKIGKSYYNSLNQLVVEVYRQGDEEIEHNFEFGKPVCFFSVGEKDQIKYFSFTGTVSYVDGDRMVVSVPDNGQLIDVQGAENVGVQLFFDETSYKMMFDALDRVIKAKGRLGYLRDLFYSRQQAETFSFAPMHFPYLNRTQEEAVNKVLRAKDVAIVHGPPGTGKTTTLVEAIYETLRRENQVLVCAQSNMAVDWISEKLVDRGINVLRIGNPTRVNDKMLSFTYERRFEAHPDYELLWAIRKAIRELRAHRKRGDEKYHQKLERLKERATELEVRINAQLFDEARVIACTLVGSANRLLEGQKFGTLFIDEAAQALEAACWIPIRRVSRVILAGDHCQLPPTVKSFAALKAGLGKTLMERIVDNKPEVVTLLKMQYRMNEEIMRFSSDWFYGNQVESAPEVKFRSILDLDIPMTWVDTSQFQLPENEESLFKEEFVGESFGRINKAEAELTLMALENYFGKIGKQRILDERIDVGVISPYRAQVQYLRRLLKKKDFFKPYRHLISVNTVDGFQGQERDVILISLVRANDEGQIGFLRDLRRMNVAITRARMKLIILGDASTMTRHPFYKKLYEYIDAL
ncbi:AAA domain-containing protein [Prevotella sp. ne3005]|uniref:AAA domain-containing protein n=1 Tax=Prevotella sp. ne3005 TaxID=1761887 RepID=UPI0008ACA012|nr:AAA domain-containing protein [Prevotella sp. ne3005]SEM77039.1 AAA domain-containing protein [Prevotella sp. ne3005]